MRMSGGWPNSSSTRQARMFSQKAESNVDVVNKRVRDMLGWRAITRSRLATAPIWKVSCRTRHKRRERTRGSTDALNSDFSFTFICTTAAHEQQSLLKSDDKMAEEAKTLFTETSAYSLAAVAMIGFTASTAANAFLPENARWQDRAAFVWLVRNTCLRSAVNCTNVSRDRRLTRSSISHLKAPSSTSLPSAVKLSRARALLPNFGKNTRSQTSDGA